MAKYDFWIPGFFIQETRSAVNDTLVASSALQVLNEQGALHKSYTPQSIRLGDHQTQDSVNMFFLAFSGVDVPDPTPAFPDGGAICWSFILANSGQADNGVFIDALNNAANAVSGSVVGAVIGGSNPWLLLVAAGIVGVQALVKLLNAACDGVVATQAWKFNAIDLANMTSGNTNWQDSAHYPGTDSPSGCGVNSDYTVGYLITNRRAVTVPNLFQKSQSAAEHIATQLTLGIQVVNSIEGNVSVPTVEKQTPSAGTVVPPETWINVNVEVPKSGHTGPIHTP